VVTTNTEAALRTATAGGGTVTFACDGTITLSNTIAYSLDTVLDAAGRRIRISGGDLVRVFYVATNVTLSINNLTIAQGRSTTSGAGIFNDYGTVNATNATFSSNNVVGITGASSPELGAAGSVAGGALANFGVAHLVNCTFTGNSAVGAAGSAGSWGGVGASGGAAAGGSIWNPGTLSAIGCSLYANLAAGGRGGDGAPGPSLPFPTPGYPGGPGGDGSGGAVFNSGVAGLVNCTLALNTGAGGVGGWGGPGYPYPGYPPASPGPNGVPGGAFGGVCDASGQCYLTNCTLAFNSGYGMRVGQYAGPAMVNTLLEENSPANCAGTITDLGHNLSSDSTCQFTAIGSMNNTPALLGPLADNGGPTLTMALTPGSPAIDAGDTTNAPATDERGFPRPAGAASDIGAYEFASVMPALKIFSAAGNSLALVASGNAGQTCRLLTSADLVHWVSAATNQFANNGTASFQDNVPTGACRFYRLTMP
jgi:hypothetical protein